MVLSAKVYADHHSNIGLDRFFTVSRAYQRHSEIRKMALHSFSGDNLCFSIIFCDLSGIEHLRGMASSYIYFPLFGDSLRHWIRLPSGALQIRICICRCYGNIFTIDFPSASVHDQKPSIPISVF